MEAYIHMCCSLDDVPNGLGTGSHIAQMDLVKTRTQSYVYRNRTSTLICASVSAKPERMVFPLILCIYICIEILQVVVLPQHNLVGFSAYTTLYRQSQIQEGEQTYATQ